ncbi:unnamed protein product [Notodromas monacha]|uniref:Superoxide dismutase copper/zinc binding domain-containing protein n=1 Tax=Notodromas monacha TaxID=399045 RepID=A0A7R9BT84_9CRUS|nr:unnamed protein product [Notodromas monacha]CAG0919694.1 unnamed protein product [Notodromas monacha]
MWEAILLPTLQYLVEVHCLGAPSSAQCNDYVALLETNQILASRAQGWIPPLGMMVRSALNCYMETGAHPSECGTLCIDMDLAVPPPFILPLQIGETIIPALVDICSMRYILCNGMVPICVVAFLVLTCPSEGIRLVSRISRNGLRGNITFEQKDSNEAVVLNVNIEDTDALTDKDYSIGLYENPVDYSVRDYCRNAGKLLVDLTKFMSEPGKLKSKEIRISPALEPDINIIGLNGTIWGRSIHVRSKNAVGCGSIHGEALDGSDVQTKTVRARFIHPLGGSVWFRTVEFSSGHSFSLIYANLYDVTRVGSTTQHQWTLHATEARFASEDASEENCQNLPEIFDPTDNLEHCNSAEPSSCPVGMLDLAHGLLSIGSADDAAIPKQYVNTQLVVPSLNSQVLYLIVKDAEFHENFYACAKLKPSSVRSATASFSANGVSGQLKFLQESPFEPTHLQTSLNGLSKLASGFHIHEYPVPPLLDKDAKVCSETGGHYNPFVVDQSRSPPPAYGTHDEYELGDLSGKHGILRDQESVEGFVWDTMLPLWGPFSIIGRSVVIHKEVANERWVCSTLLDSRRLTRAVVRFMYPLVGTVEFKQAADDPEAETTVFIDSLVYSDTTASDTSDHGWRIHVKPPATFQDSINWQKRCMSPEGQFNPFGIDKESPSYSLCSALHPEYCVLGDLVSRMGTLKIAGSQEKRSETRVFFTDTFLPLAGRRRITDRSIVIYGDDHMNRGERLACTKILRAFRNKAVASKWSTNDFLKKIVGGSVEFTQESPYDPTVVRVSLGGLDRLARDYSIHETSVELENEFPCLTTGPSWNPFKVSGVKLEGETTIDEREVGDLSGKHGGLNGLSTLRTSFNDSSLSLFGSTSLLGRSVVVYQPNEKMWSCASIVFGYDPSEAEHRSAIASFHHPGGFVRGYIRFRQVRYKNGYESETYIEVNLQHNGDDPNKESRGHNWAVFNARVGADASVKYQPARCSAAGNRWSPVFVSTYDREAYDRDCGRNLPLRCEAGDMSGKLGPISIGGRDGHFVLSDTHYPLCEVALGRDNGMTAKSLVIFDEDGSSLRYACANIEPDDDIVRTVVVQKTSRFSFAEFMKEVRAILGAPPWMVVLNMGESKDSHSGDCVQLLIHFLGPFAQRLSQDMAHLQAGGSLPSPTMSIPGLPIHPKRSLSFKPCSQALTRVPENDDFFDQSNVGNSGKPGLFDAALVIGLVMFSRVLA